ncbi:MAG TPA: peptidoglycan-binding protein [Thermohalobaculum sp.]|nr:peptidoglycan-binding protein [Thermohalobaculum sp.]
MDLAATIRAIAPSAPNDAVSGLLALREAGEVPSAFANPFRVAHLVGQCAHESGGFTRRVESLYYSSGARIFAVFGRKYFGSFGHAGQFARNQQKLANRVYANRMGNGDTRSGDGFRFRGRGYLQLTGRDNYRIFGKRIGIDIEAEPERAADPETAWRIAACYLANRSRSGRTAFEWADQNNVEMVTRIVNGGTIGIADRRHLTAKALSALGGVEAHPALLKGAEGPAVLLLQKLLAERGFSPGALDGDFGMKTERAIKAFQRDIGLIDSGRADAALWGELDRAIA